YRDGDRLPWFGRLPSAARSSDQQCAAGPGVDSASAPVHEDQLRAGHGSAAKYSGREYDVRSEHDQSAGEFGAELVRRWICDGAAQGQSGVEFSGELHMVEESVECAGLPVADVRILDSAEQ